jgi:hypothetical protein
MSGLSRRLLGDPVHGEFNTGGESQICYNERREASERRTIQRSAHPSWVDGRPLEAAKPVDEQPAHLAPVNGFQQTLAERVQEVGDRRLPDDWTSPFSSFDARGEQTPLALVATRSGVS